MFNVVVLFFKMLMWNGIESTFNVAYNKKGCNECCSIVVHSLLPRNNNNALVLLPHSCDIDIQDKYIIQSENDFFFWKFACMRAQMPRKNHLKKLRQTRRTGRRKKSHLHFRIFWRLTMRVRFCFNSSVINFCNVLGAILMSWEWTLV